MATISHKDVPEELATRLKLAALHAHKSIRAYTVDALTEAVARDLDGPSVDPVQRKRVASAPAMPASAERSIEYDED